MIYSANCKVNIGLNILSRREDGYHDLSTVIYPAIGLSDALEVVHSEEFRFTSSGLVIDCPLNDNLCVKAYKLLKTTIGEELPPVHIHLHKVVPFGAGLGGGSSDATFALIGINDLLGLKLTEGELIDLAAQLGSDTPFFVKNRAQLCSSRGEVMENIAIDLKGLYMTIIKPDISISTREAFSGIVPKIPNFDLSQIAKTDINEWKYLVKNDFENTIFQLKPQLKIIKDQLYELGAIYSSMSGSGSAIFALSYDKLPVLKFQNCFCRSFLI